MTPEDDAVAGHLVRRLAPEPGAGAGCSGDNALAALLEGRLEGRARTDLERHLVACSACGAVVAEALAMRGGVAARPEDALRMPVFRRRVAWAAAAAIVVGTGVTVWALGRSGPDGPSEPEATLTATAASLRTARPDLFGDFRPLSPAELAAVAPIRLRGGLAVVRPAETVLARRPAVEWAPAPGATSHVAVVAIDGGKEVWRRTSGVTASATPPDDAPDLVPGTKYVARIEARGPLGTSEATRRFSVASAEESARFTEGLREIDVRAPPAERPILRAHYAIRRGLLLEAERHLATQVISRPDDAPAKETLLYVRRRLGVPEP